MVVVNHHLFFRRYRAARRRFCPIAPRRGGGGVRRGAPAGRNCLGVFRSIVERASVQWPVSRCGCRRRAREKRRCRSARGGAQAGKGRGRFSSGVRPGAQARRPGRARRRQGVSSCPDRSSLRASTDWWRRWRWRRPRDRGSPTVTGARSNYPSVWRASVTPPAIMSRGTRPRRVASASISRRLISPSRFAVASRAAARPGLYLGDAGDQQELCPLPEATRTRKCRDRAVGQPVRLRTQHVAVPADRSAESGFAGLHRCRNRGRAAGARCLPRARVSVVHQPSRASARRGIVARPAGPPLVGAG